MGYIQLNYVIIPLIQMGREEELQLCVKMHTEVRSSVTICDVL